MKKINLKLLKQLWSVAHLYWLSSEKWGAIFLLVVIIILSIIVSGLLVAVAIFLGEITSALVAQDTQRFQQALLIFVGVIVIGTLCGSFKVYCQAKLSLYWRRWLTHYFLNSYLKNSTFYYISEYSKIDNPDQRISEDIKTFTQQSIILFSILLDSVLQLIAFTGTLWTISQFLMTFLVSYSLIGTLFATLFFGRILVGINFEQLQREADLRYGLIQIREQAESIAFYQGQHQEFNQVWNRFNLVFSNFKHLIQWQLYLNLFQNSYQYLTFIVPGLILAPKIVSGELEVGVVTQAGTAFKTILIALTLMIAQLDKLSVLGATINRLDQLKQTIITANTFNSDQTEIKIIESSELACQNLTLQTPDHQRTIIKNLSFSVSSGENLLIIGASGVGKSSLLRAISGLWTSGSGVIYRPKREDILFLPQRPYVFQSSLREQLLYPQTEREIADEKLYHLLHKVNLSNLVEKWEGLNKIADWSKILSMGEQQRLAFARLFLYQPDYAVLDEATSALDLKNEELLYQELQAFNITYISVSHRMTLLKYHQNVLKLEP
ncbi:MAG: ABC transporter ATP-binding protein/permease [Lyngbya sp.]|nr:ABC transporter ATP-binding protein/permease [Lyngbya sp.]